MKKHSLALQILIFLLIFTVFILPPLLPAHQILEESNFTAWTFPLLQIINGTVFLLFYCLIFNKNDEQKQPQTSPKGKIVYFSFTVVFTLSLLFCNSLIFKFLSVLLPQFNNSLSINKPDTFISFLFCIINFLFSAVYEEILYRAYFSNALKQILIHSEVQDIKSKIITIFIEIAGTLLFAFAHYYGGWLSVFNAVIAHLILRFIFIKTKNIYTNIIAHWLYNILILFIF